MRSLGAEYDVERQGAPAGNHHRNNRCPNILPLTVINKMITCTVSFLMSCSQPYFVPHISSIFFLVLILNHFRKASDGMEAAHTCKNPREVSSTHSSPCKTLPRPPRDPRSIPPTPVMTRNAYSSSQLRCGYWSSAGPSSSISFLLTMHSSKCHVSFKTPTFTKTSMQWFNFCFSY